MSKRDTPLKLPQSTLENNRVLMQIKMVKFLKEAYIYSQINLNYGE